jgi:phosphoenolpyruvate---glycerone phosphotransferase subunit DhaM
MVGFVIVSHSSKVAEGVKDIAEEMNMGNAKIIAAGGADEGRIGTNTLKIKDCIEEIYDGDHILLFADLGSAVLSAEQAIDMLDEEIKKKVTIVDAPLVEGTITAVIMAGATDDLQDIIARAEDSKNLKKVQ